MSAKDPRRVPEYFTLTAIVVGRDLAHMAAKKRPKNDRVKERWRLRK